MHKLIPEMKKRKLLSHFLLTFLLLAASDCFRNIPIMAQATKSDVELGLAPSANSQYILFNQEMAKRVKAKMIHKNPSGPNPIGHWQPPSKH